MHLRSIGHRLAQLRWSSRLTPKALALRLRLPEDVVCRIEAGESDIDVLTLIDYSTFFGTSVRELLVSDELQPHDECTFLNSDYRFSFPCDLSTIGDYRRARKWYELRRKRLEWLWQKFRYARAKRARELELARSRREDLQQQRTRRAHPPQSFSGPLA